MHLKWNFGNCIFQKFLALYLQSLIAIPFLLKFKMNFSPHIESLPFLQQPNIAIVNPAFVFLFLSFLFSLTVHHPSRFSPSQQHSTAAIEAESFRRLVKLSLSLSLVSLPSCHPFPSSSHIREHYTAAGLPAVPLAALPSSLPL
jgi:hypothetical protein